MRDPNQGTFRQPDVIVPPRCIERCSGLRRLVEGAILSSVDQPDVQKAVVCPRYGRIACHAATFTEGTFGHVFGESVGDSGDCFLVNPVPSVAKA